MSPSTSCSANFNLPALGYGWTHIAVVRSSGSWKIYVNGELAETWASADPADKGSLMIGRGKVGWTKGGFMGKSAHWAVYDQPLDAGQVSAHFFAMDLKQPPPPPPPPEQILGGNGAGGLDPARAHNAYAADPTGSGADPVNTSSGAFWTNVSDITVPGAGVAFALARSYNSADVLSGPLGPGWTHSLNVELIITSGEITARAGDAQQITFTDVSGALGARCRCARFTRKRLWRL